MCAMYVYWVLFCYLGAVTHGQDKNYEVSSPETTTTVDDATTDPTLLEEGAGKAVTYPCICSDSKCSCCTGNILQNFNITMRQKLCSHFAYDPDDFALGVRIAFNERVLYQTRVSGKNPPPMCIPIPRITALRVCLRINNLYFIGRNVHACVGLETHWQKETALALNFDCIRLGVNGVAVVKPEDGGGLPVNKPIDSTTDDIEDYDENVTGPDKPPKKKKVKT